MRGPANPTHWLPQAATQLTFRIAITAAVMAFIAALAACLIFIQIATFHAAAREAASTAMDAASANTLSRLEAQVSQLSSRIRVLSKSPSLTDSDDRGGNNGAPMISRGATRNTHKRLSIGCGSFAAPHGGRTSQSPAIAVPWQCGWPPPAGSLGPHVRPPRRWRAAPP